jgi:hypothetical protein
VWPYGPGGSYYPRVIFLGLDPLNISSAWSAREVLLFRDTDRLHTLCKKPSPEMNFSRFFINVPHPESPVFRCGRAGAASGNRLIMHIVSSVGIFTAPSYWLFARPPLSA